jgi:uncharacterized protein (TIGR02001 family)
LVLLSWALVLLLVHTNYKANLVCNNTIYFNHWRTHMKVLKMTSIAAALLASAGFSQVASAEGSWSANIGVVSQYHFRGLQQTSSASASAGVDYENGGFYFGSWAADVADGLEVDFYTGYVADLGNGLSLGGGVTTYQYTGTFDSAYNEVNLYAGLGLFSLEVSVGKQREDLSIVNDAGEGISEADYSFVALSAEKNGFSGTIGYFGKDFDGEYLELGYSTEISGFDVGVGVLFSGTDLNDNENMFFSIGKSFDL